MRIYDNMVKRSRKKGRLPSQAGEIMEEIRKRLRTCIMESDYNKRVRLDKEFDAFKQGPMAQTLSMLYLRNMM